MYCKNQALFIKELVFRLSFFLKKGHFGEGERHSVGDYCQRGERVSCELPGYLQHLYLPEIYVGEEEQQHKRGQD